MYVKPRNPEVFTHACTKQKKLSCHAQKAGRVSQQLAILFIRCLRKYTYMRVFPVIGKKIIPTTSADLLAVIRYDSFVIIATFSLSTICISNSTRLLCCLYCTYDECVFLASFTTTAIKTKSVAAAQLIFQLSPLLTVVQCRSQQLFCLIPPFVSLSLAGSVVICLGFFFFWLALIFREMSVARSEAAQPTQVTLIQYFPDQRIFQAEENWQRCSVRLF